MPASDRNLGARVLEHLLELAASRCSITEETLHAEEDPETRDILTGILTLHEDLEHQEKLRQEKEELEDRVNKQSRAILELSTPVIEVWRDVLILPLIGTVDTNRAQQILEQVLSAVAEKAAAVLIVDITGVPVVDTGVASHLIKTTEAVKLLGAHCILTGVSPTNAQTLVKLGVDLSTIMTKSSLNAGLKAAFALTNRIVVEKSDSVQR